MSPSQTLSDPASPSREHTGLLPHYLIQLCWCAQLDRGEALRAVDMGPPAESPKAAAFREFWGDRAELRRYKVDFMLVPACWHLAVPHYSSACPETLSHVEH